jgi:2-C-methyl-D-erythritol 4-phosphate cytidylyltransferase
MKVWGVVPAAGSGTRMGSGDPKQYREAAGVPILIHTLRALLDSGAVEGITVAAAADWIDRARILVAEHLTDAAPVLIVAGGATRQQSVHRALASLSGAGVQIVVIHDAARPFATGRTIRDTVAAARRHGAAVAAVPAAEASCLTAGGLVAEYIDRGRHVIIQTPQAFRYDLIMTAHEQAVAAGLTDAVDDGLLVVRLGQPVAVTGGSPDNIKITYGADTVRLEELRAHAGKDRA